MYSVPPPSYAGQPKSHDLEPLLPPSSDSIDKRRDGAGWAQTNLRNSWTDQAQPGDIPEDFLVGVTVSQSSVEIRMAFIRKVYSILFLQIAATTVVASLMRLDSCRSLLLAHSWVIFIPLVGAVVSMLVLFAKRHSSPANLILLGLFTVLEAVGLGAAVAFVNTIIILEALVLTALVFIGLTLYTLQSKRDFSGMGPYLGTALMVMIFSSFLTIFFPLSQTMDAVYAGFGTLVFSAYIVFDTQMICKHLSPDDWVVACVSLYLDGVNLFINIVRILSDLQER
ncbi:hypothetical protein PCANC_11764 [Puccinia coronata f. sp. avenae]|uniref:Uncharacterized protein n=1 Tax=Puccinia coronata f. sp. avenae TaxID=200324 RepID=A0A2N5UY03_9BASI|nr:hypothetical protein PCANC_11764 [Puccinia coronata f. sp. avenae]